MIAFRCVSSDELLKMINDKKEDDYRSRWGENTFHYEKNNKYKHFFVYADHTKFFNNLSIIGVYIIPNEIIYEKGFGFYGGVKSKFNDALIHEYFPIPEIIIKEEDFKKEYLYELSPVVNYYYIQKDLRFDANEKYNEKKEEMFRGDPNTIGYLDYSYADVYYELVYYLAKQNDMNMHKVAALLMNKNLNEEINNFHDNNIKYFDLLVDEYKKVRR